MTDQQLYLAIGVPILVNTATMLLGFTLMSNSLNKRIDDLRSDINSRLDLMSKLLPSNSDGLRM